MSGRISSDVGQWAPVPRWLLDHPGVSDRAVRLFAILATLADDEHRLTPGRKTLAARMRCSLDSLDRAKHELVAAKALEITHRESGGAFVSNDYLIKYTSPVRPPSRSGAVTPSRTAAASVTREVQKPSREERTNVLSSDFSKNGHHDDPAGVRRVYDHWRRVRGKTRANYAEMSTARRGKIKTRLREFSVDELCRALDAVALDDWPGRDAHDDLTVLLGSREKVDRWLDKAEGKGVVAEHLSREQRRELADRRLRERMAERGVQ